MIEIKELTVKFNKGAVVKDVSFTICEGEVLGIIGESGSGKSITAYSIMNLLPKTAKVVSGDISRDVVSQGEIAMIYQEPSSALNPVMKVGKQVENAVRIHFSSENKKLTKAELKEKAIKFMEGAGLTDCEKLYSYYPNQLSGGMRQRILIAMALACKPKLIIADEPTTALDSVTRNRIIERLRKINEEYNTAILLISHDFDVISAICERVIVMKHGHIIEENTTEELLSNPRDAYTKELVAAALMKRFSKFENGKVLEKRPFLEVKNVNGYYNDKGRVKILDEVSFVINEGEIFGLVGQSGSGKSTLAKVIAGLMWDAKGSILLDGKEINQISRRARRHYSRDIQIVFQDPFTSLNPKMKVGRFIEEPLRIHKIYKTAMERKARVIEILSLVGLDAEYYDRYPSELSGGQRQRISIAAALILNPHFIIMDEPVSAVDLAVEAQIIELIKDIHDKFNITFLFISHDMKLVKGICNRIAVIEDGRIISIDEVER